MITKVNNLWYIGIGERVEFMHKNYHEKITGIIENIILQENESKYFEQSIDVFLVMNDTVYYTNLIEKGSFKLVN